MAMHITILLLAFSITLYSISLSEHNGQPVGSSRVRFFVSFFAILTPTMVL